MINIIVWSLCVILSSCTLAQSQNAIGRRCSDVSSDKENCYTLYSDDTDIVTWETASQRCSAANQQLAVIEDNSAWAMAQELIQESSVMTGHGIWTSGRRSTNNRWLYLETRFSKMLDGSYPSGKYCATVSSQSSEPRSEICTDRHYALCQYPLETSSSHETTEDCAVTTPTSDGDVCLSLLNLQMTWFEARNYCREKYNGGDLASVQYIPSSAFVDTEASSGYTGAGRLLTVWIGLQRRPWIWSIDKADETPIDHFYFGQGEGSDPDQSCLFLRKSTGGAVHWADQRCDSGVKYYMCQAESESFAAAPQIPTGREGSPTTKESSVSNTVYIAVGISVVGVVSISGTLIFLYIRRKQMIRAKRNEDRARSIRQVTDLSQDTPGWSGSMPERPRISSPIPLDAPYPVSGYSNLGPLIPVTPGTDHPDAEQTYAEIPNDRAGSPVASTSQAAWNIFGEFNPYAVNVNFAESVKPSASIETTELDMDTNTDAQRGTPQSTRHYGSSDSVNHMTTYSGDEYALSNKTSRDLDDVIVDNMTYHSKY